MTPPQSLITGHRGASSVAPENTLSAFRTAWEIGCDAVEGDFRLTRDGIIVCIHDANTQRTTGVDKEISEVSFSSLQKLDFGAWKDARFAGEACPTIDEVLATVPPHRHIFIELKTGPEIIQPLKTSLHKSSLLIEQITLITFNKETANQCKRFLPEYRLHWLTEFQRLENKPNSWFPSAKELATTAHGIGADGVGLQANRHAVTKQFLRQLRAAGISEFHVWTVDDPEDAIFFIHEGAFAVATNTPARLRDHIQFP